MPIQENLQLYPEWADGDHVLYNDYVIKISKGDVVQQGSFRFLYRTNVRPDITEWLLNHCVHDGILTTNRSGYLSDVRFETGVGAMDFKLRWYGGTNNV